MLRELRVSEMRYRAVLEVLDGAVISAVARRYGVSRQTVHAWLRRYARDGAVLNVEDRSSRPHGCPHQIAPEVEARVLALRDAHPRWGPTRIVYELAREGVMMVPGRSSVYRALVRNGRIDPARRRRRRADYKRWERGRPMELWQMDVVGGVHLGDGSEVKVITGIDDNSRFVVSAKVVARATARPVCEALVEALARHGSAQIAALDARIQEEIAPFSAQAARLADIPGVDAVAAAELIAEIGVDMTRFPSDAHLVSWAKFCPQTHQSAGKSKTKGRGRGNPWLAGTLGRIAFANSRADTFLGARYRRLARRRGKQKAIVATGNSVLSVVYHLLSNPGGHILRSRARILRIPDQQTPRRPRSGHPTTGTHRPADHDPRR